MRILPVSTIDDTKTILQVVMRLQKYLEDNPIRNVFYIDEEYSDQQVAYDKTKVSVPTQLNVNILADDIIIFKNSYVAVVDSVGSEYVVIKENEVVSIKGEKGDTGETGATGATGADGRDGADGEDGVGITSITKTGTEGLVDTYTITFTNGTTSTFTVTNGRNGTNGTNGRGIVSIEKTSTVGLVDTYTITYTDATTSTFTVTNGGSATFPSGGTTGQVLGKLSNSDNDVGWLDSPKYINDNLIINPDFKINQRGSASYTNSTSDRKYTFDRWFIKVYDGSGTVQLQKIDNTVEMSSTALGMVGQQIEFDNSYLSKHFIASAKINGVVVSFDFNVPSSIPVSTTQLNYFLSETYAFEAYMYSNGNIEIVIKHIGVNAQTVVIEWVKLECSNVRSQFIAPNYVLEVEKCKYYFETIANSSPHNCRFIISGSSYSTSIEFYLSKKRVTPTVSRPCYLKPITSFENKTVDTTFYQPTYSFKDGGNCLVAYVSQTYGACYVTVDSADTNKTNFDAEIY